MYFQNDTFKKNRYSDGSHLHQSLSCNVVSKQRHKNENAEYHGMLISFKSRHLYHFSPVWVVEVNIISSCLSKVKVFPMTLT